MRYILNKNLQLRDTKHKGRGVFSKGVIKKNTIIEESQYILISRNKTVPGVYPYTYPHPVKDGIPVYAIVLGFGSMYNDSETEEDKNIIYEVDEANKLYRYITTREINNGEELVLYYRDKSINVT